MEKVIVASLRGTFCALMFAGLAACNGGSDSAATPTTPSAQQPVVPSSPSNPTQPTTPSAPADENVAPHIAGSPSNEVLVGQAFNFTPSATDADGDDLTFSIVSKPSWATFDASTGHLYGTPSASDVGSHEDIAISVSDGAHTASLAQFAVNVVEQGNASVSITWQPPTENTDGSSLTNLKGYKIHYGTAPGSYDQTLTINNAGLASYVIDNLAAGTYYFAVSAVTTKGVESELSAEASKTI